MDIYYDLYDAEGDTCSVILSLSADGGSTFSIAPKLVNLGGDIGMDILPGTGKYILWDAGAEDIDYDGNQFVLKITVNDENILAPENFVYVPGGTFTMGDTRGVGYFDELPVHQVTLDSFYIGKYEVTQSEWQAVMNTNPAHDYGMGDNYPVYFVSWYAILKYCNLRSMNEGLTPVYTISGSTNPANWGTVPTNYNTAWDAAICNWNANGYRLPTEAEWEYAARGGTNNPDYLYAGSDNIDLVAWYDGNNTPYSSKPVGGKAANGLGLYDMSGNVLEWCWDWYSSTYYNESPLNNPTGPASGSYRLLRGGSWNYYATYCRVSFRNFFSSPYYGLSNYGFRLCRAN
ncbi:MAG: SUMF1/EgtB/PvdO family nonheme iron enzyme [Candidatus Cloacimonadaceae bacterium]